jgi:hypothetical protein
VGLQETGIFALKVFTVSCLFLCVLVANAVAGMNEFESCQCKNGLATKGDPKEEIKQECGQPVLVKYNVRKDCDEMWLYNFGPNEFMQGICFDRSGRVKKVLSLTSGY